MAWPPKGFVPVQNVYPLWSFVMRGADFANATVTMARPDGTAVPAAIQSRVSFAGPGIVWLANGLSNSCPRPPAGPCSDTWPSPASDEPIDVVVSNVVIGGVARTFNYRVTVFDPAVADPSRTPISITGPDHPALNVPSTFTANAIPNATGYQWRTTKLTPFELVDGAEAGVGNFEARVGGYDPISTASAASGTSAFRLTTGEPGGAVGGGQQTLTLRQTVVPDAASQLTFKTRAHRLTNITGALDVSTDDGATWNALYTEGSTDGAAFTNQTVPLGRFAGQHIRLRLRAENAGTGNTSFRSGEGWFVDDIVLTGSSAAAAPITSAAGAPPSFTFTLTEAAQFDIEVRPQFAGSGFGAWSAPKRVAPLPISVAPAITAQPQSATIVDGGAASFTVAASGTAPLSFEWSRNGTPLVDGPGVAGSRSATLNLTNAGAPQAGAYRVQVTNAVGTVTSSDAVLTVTPPPPPAPAALTLAGGVDNATVGVATSGAQSWVAQTAVSHDGVDAVRSGAVGHGQSTTLSATVTGPATVSFWWKAESEASFDFLNVDVDGVAPFAGISGNVDWQQKTIVLPAGAHTIRWVYSKDGSVSVGQDAGWVDQITVGAAAPPPPAPAALTLAGGVDNATVGVATSGAQSWVAQTAVSHDGVDAVRSGAVGHGQSTTLSATVTGPATVSFWWKAESEASFDFLNVDVDGVAPFAGISGNVDWQQKTIVLPAGAHTIRWVYSKDGSVSVGQDAGWVDQITVGAAAPPPPAPAALTLAGGVDNATVGVATSGAQSWVAQTAVSHDGVDAVRSGAVGHGQSTTLSATVTGPATVSFWWKAESEASFDFLNVDVDGVAPFAGISGNVDWQQKTIVLPAGAHTIRWVYSKDGSVSVGQDAGWVDQITVGAAAPPPPAP